MGQPQRSFVRTIVALLGAGLAGLYLSNIGMGVLGEIPDAFPVLGNLDEVLASAILFSCLSYLGINVVPQRWQPGAAPRAEVLEADRASTVESP